MQVRQRKMETMHSHLKKKEVSSKKRNQSDDKEVNWKVFKGDTEASRLLSRLYGVQANKDCAIQYPKVKVGKQKLDDRTPWNQSDIKTKTSQRNLVKVPKFGLQKQKKVEHINKVSSIPRRKTYASCQQTLEQNSMLNLNYRPPVSLKQNVSNEKDRLCKLHEYGGGCALPDELTIPKQPIPEDRTRDKGRKSQQSSKDDNLSTNTKDSNLAGVIVGEIKERRDFQIAMEDMGCGDQTRSKIVSEIECRMRELRVLDPSTAEELIADM